MLTIHLTKTEFQAVASMVNATNPKDNVAALSMVKVTANEDGSLTLLATNRFTIATQTFTPGRALEPDTDGTSLTSVMLTPTMLKAIKATKEDGYLMVDAGNVSLVSGSTHIMEIRPKMDMPNLADYIPSEEDLAALTPTTDPIRLNLDLIVQVSKLRAPSDLKTDNPVFDMFTQNLSERGKPKPIIFKRAALLAVVQPMYTNK